MSSQEPHREETATRAGTFVLEINNLMESVLGNVAILENDLGSGHSGVRALSTIKEAALRVGRIAAEFNAVDRGVGAPQENMNVNPMVCRSLILEEQELAPDVRIVRNVDPDLWDISGDRAQVSELIDRLAKHALGTIPQKGRVVLTTRNLNVDDEFGAAGLDLPSGPYVYVTIEAHIWRDPEDQVSADNRPDGVVDAVPSSEIEELASKSGVHLSTDSDGDWGIAYHLYLPALTRTARRMASTPEVASGAKGSETILVVDDDQMVVDVTRIVLKRLGYTVLVARNGREALDTVNSHEGPIALALLDLVMPVMGGAEAFPLLKRARPEMKIIICTGFAKGSTTGALQNAGVSEFLLKPFGPQTLTMSIRRALDGGAATLT